MLYLPQVASRAALHQWHTGSKGHAVDVAPSVKVVKAVEYQGKA